MIYNQDGKLKLAGRYLATNEKYEQFVTDDVDELHEWVNAQQGPCHMQDIGFYLGPILEDMNRER
jgi:hypothetical protein